MLFQNSVQVLTDLMEEKAEAKQRAMTKIRPKVGKKPRVDTPKQFSSKVGLALCNMVTTVVNGKNVMNFYPAKELKLQVAKDNGLTETQVNTWLGNARRRRLPRY